jgi:6-phosphogluconolactonase
MADNMLSQAQISVSSTMDDLVRTAATGIVDAARGAVAARGIFTIALSGGSTPKLLYQLLATSDISADLPWQDVHVYWGDERHVPPDSPESNFRMAREALLDHVPIPDVNVHRILAELPNAGTAALAYADEIRQGFGLENGTEKEMAAALPRFDLILLGMGEDGHTASLFPYSPALRERKSLVVANAVEKLATTRITLTYPVINNAARVWFIVAGGSKAQILKEVLEGHYLPEALPSQAVNPTDGELVFLLDSTAAAGLSSQVRGDNLAGIG